MPADDPFDRLEAVIRQRMDGDPDQSYVARLHARGMPKIAQKLGEEAVECVIAAVRGDRDGLIGEAADLMFHLLVLLAEAGVPLDAVRGEIARRDGLGGLAEKAGRR